MKNSILGLAAAVAVLGSVAAAHAQGVAAGDAARGKQLFLQDGCYACHGTTGDGGGFAGPRLAHDGLPPDAMLQQLRSPAASMPVFTAEVLPDKDAADIIAYIQSLSSGPAPTAANIPILNH
jgi:mono/diheme cytochrome c family protein